MKIGNINFVIISNVFEFAQKTGGTTLTINFAT